MQNSRWRSLTLLCALCVFPALVFGHAGNVDQNGGHYYGNSYHCHMPNCVMPDTFDISRMRRDGISTNYRDREKFFNIDDWSYEEDWDGDCQSTRQEMLVLTNRGAIKFTNPRNCVVRTGEWFDEYTGKVFEVAAQMDLDHVIPLMYAHTHGGDRWPAEKKLQFANDPENLMLIDRNEMKRKNERGPDRYLPREEFQCEYARLWEAISDKYDLTIESRDRNEIRRILKECPEQ